MGRIRSNNANIQGFEFRPFPKSGFCRGYYAICVVDGYLFVRINTNGILTNHPISQYPGTGSGTGAWKSQAAPLEALQTFGFITAVEYEEHRKIVVGARRSRHQEYAASVDLRVLEDAGLKLTPAQKGWHTRLKNKLRKARESK